MFHIALIEVARREREAGNISESQFVGLKHRLESDPGLCKWAEERAITEAPGQNVTLERDESGTVNWEKVGDFLKWFLPILLEFLALVK